MFLHHSEFLLSYKVFLPSCARTGSTRLSLVLKTAKKYHKKKRNIEVWPFQSERGLGPLKRIGVNACQGRCMVRTVSFNSIITFVYVAIAKIGDF